MIAKAALLALMQQCAPQVAPDTLHAIVMTESEGDPFRIGVNAGAELARQPRNLAEAVATARGLLAKGANFDAGLGQINSANFDRLGLKPENMFDPCTNLRAAAVVLQGNYKRARAGGSRDPLAAAISTYNTGSPTRGFGNGYVAKVFNNAGAASRQGRSSWSADAVGQVLIAAFGGRITDTWRPMNASYGAANSYHKFGKAVDFVPRGGVNAITRAQIRAVLESQGIEILELLGPGNPEHDDHWHVAFGSGDNTAPRAPTVTLASRDVQEAENVAADLSPPPEWDVFAVQRWRQAQSAQTEQSFVSGGEASDGAQ